MSTEFQQRAASLAIVKMFKEKHFSIVALDAIASTLGIKERCAGRDYDALRALHCMDWADMGHDMARMVREKCLEILALPPQAIDIVATEVKEPKDKEPMHEKSTKLRLAFWR